MSFDFLENNDSDSKEKQGAGTSKERGGKVFNGKNVFYDFYESHFDAHRLFSSPPLKSEFKKVGNFKVAEDLFSEQGLKLRNENDLWFGPGTSTDKLKDGYTEFANPKLLNDTLNDLKEEIPDSLFSGIEKPKMKINDRFGMFSFDLASMAMTYVYEYFDKKGNKVDANYIVKKGSKFYDSVNNVEVEQRIKRRENGTPVVVSSVRNSLIDFEKKDKNERAVEIFIVSSYSYKEKSRNILFNTMAGISVAKNLISKGFKVKVTGLTVVKEQDVTYHHMVPVKRYNQPLDVNAAAYVCGDPRFWRYQGFKMIIYGCDQNNITVDPGLGYIQSNISRISNAIETDYVPNSNLTQADTRLYFGGSRSMTDTKKEVEKALEILNTKYSENVKNTD